MTTYLQTFAQCASLAQTRKRKLANNTYLVLRDDGGYGIKLHDTEIVIHYQDRIVLDSGGWQTVTTKARMNDFSPFRVWQQRGVWYVTSADRDTAVFADGITFHADGRISGEGRDPKETEKTRKAINKYAREYAAEFIAGNIPPPSNGDCWACLFTDSDGNTTMGPNHILQHLDERYFVPAILYHCYDSLSPFTRAFIAEFWNGGDARRYGSMADIAKSQIQSAVRRFCLSELGMAR